MKTCPVKIALLFLCLQIATKTSCPAATNVASTFTGPDFGNWNNASNWSPMVVPNNGGGYIFDVTIPTPVDVTLDTDVSVNSFAVTADTFPPDGNIVSVDQNFTATSSSFTNNGTFDFSADTKDVTISLGNLADFSGTTLNSGWFYALRAASSRTATMRFNGANIRTNYAGIGFFGPGTHRIVNKNGDDALEHFQVNARDPNTDIFGFFQVSSGASYTMENSVTNSGQIVVDTNATLTFAKDLTLKGDIRDAPTNVNGGFLYLISSSASEPARIVINGTLTNYDPATKTLHRGRYNIIENNDPAGVGTIQVLGGHRLDIVHNDASIEYGSAGAALLDSTGADALRNLAVNFRFKLLNHDFTTVGSLTTNSDAESLLQIRGGTHFMVNGDLSVAGGCVEVSPLPAYDVTVPLINSTLAVKGKFILGHNTRTRFEVYGGSMKGTINVHRHVRLDGALEIYVLPGAPIMQGGNLALLTGEDIDGDFQNVNKKDRVTAYSIKNYDDLTAQADGDPIGTFKVTVKKDTLLISDFKPLK